MGFDFSLKKKRFSNEALEIDADLDALVSKPISFKLLNQVHTIEPISVQEFINFSAAYADFNEAAKKDTLSTDEVLEVYAKIFQSVIKTIKKDDIHKMTQAQVAALFALVVKAMTGEAQKKNLTAEIQETSQAILRG